MSQMELVNKLIEKRKITDKQVIKTLQKVDRGFFYSGSGIYDDKPKQIGYNATISAPHMHAYALQYLKPYLIPGIHALDIGSGSGYFTVCLCEMLYRIGKVIGLEHISSLLSKSYQNISAYDSSLLSSSKIELKHTDGRLGWAEFAPYQVIHVGACSPFVPDALLEQLSHNGVILIPLGETDSVQHITLVRKDRSGNISYSTEMKVCYVPLCSVSEQTG